MPTTLNIAPAPAEPRWRRDLRVVRAAGHVQGTRVVRVALAALDQALDRLSELEAQLTQQAEDETSGAEDRG